MNRSFSDFCNRFKLLSQKNQKIIGNTLSNIFTMRLVGNKTHGDLAEIGIAEFINQFMYDYRCEHVGKDLFRAKKHEEDIVIISELNDRERIPVSLKAYGDGPLQLSTDKSSKLFGKLREEIPEGTCDRDIIEKLFLSEEFEEFGKINVLPLIYREKKMQCNIMVFDFAKAKEETAKIVYVNIGEKFVPHRGIVKEKGRLYPIFMFLNKNDEYLCEVRYGAKAANALQRGLWTHTKNASACFDSLTGWVDYSHNLTLVKLLALALNATESAHREVNALLQQDIDRLRNFNGR